MLISAMLFAVTEGESWFKSEYVVAFLAVIGTVFSGAGLKWVEKKVSEERDKDTTATQLRTELRDELKRLKEELEKVETSMLEWREKYYSLYEEFLLLKAEFEVTIKRLKEINQVAPPPNRPENGVK